jgi:catalase
LATVGSVLFDAVFVPGGPESVRTLCGNAHAVLFVKEAYKHGKAIGASGEGPELISVAAQSATSPNGQFQGPGVIMAAGKSVHGDLTQRFVDAIARHRFWDRPDMDSIVA